jgi:hypothetical protein
MTLIYIRLKVDTAIVESSQGSFQAPNNEPAYQHLLKFGTNVTLDFPCQINALTGAVGHYGMVTGTLGQYEGRPEVV